MFQLEISMISFRGRVTGFRGPHGNAFCLLGEHKEVSSYFRDHPQYNCYLIK